MCKINVQKKYVEKNRLQMWAVAAIIESSRMAVRDEHYIWKSDESLVNLEIAPKFQSPHWIIVFFLIFFYQSLCKCSWDMSINI